MTQHDRDELTVVNQSAGGGLTSVVVRRVPHLSEEGGQVPTDRYGEHQGHTDPERTYKNTYADTHKHFWGHFIHLQSLPGDSDHYSLHPHIP